MSSRPLFCTHLYFLLLQKSHIIFTLCNNGTALLFGIVQAGSQKMNRNMQLASSWIQVPLFTNAMSRQLLGRHIIYAETKLKARWQSFYVAIWVKRKRNIESKINHNQSTLSIQWTSAVPISVVCVAMQERGKIFLNAYIGERRRRLINQLHSLIYV